jgi:hypothetical protein
LVAFRPESLELVRIVAYERWKPLGYVLGHAASSASLYDEKKGVPSLKQIILTMIEASLLFLKR